ncbi:MAG: hypothetical protein ACYTF9_07580 [Planctomycetota bacterium]|jgi:hypothetical protein
MQFLTELWLPILLSAVFVFIASSVMHMVLPIHKGDHKKLPNEGQVLEAMRSSGVGPGVYMFPGCDTMKEMNTPEMAAKLKLGPVGWLTVIPNGGWKMGTALTGWFIYSIVIGAIVAYIGWFAIGATGTYLEAFRVTGAAAVLGYSIGAVNESLWRGQPWSVSFKFVFDGLVYALLTAGTFGWLWPSATPTI